MMREAEDIVGAGVPPPMAMAFAANLAACGALKATLREFERLGETPKLEMRFSLQWREMRWWREIESEGWRRTTRRFIASVLPQCILFGPRSNGDGDETEEVHEEEEEEEEPATLHPLQSSHYTYSFIHPRVGLH